MHNPNIDKVVNFSSAQKYVCRGCRGAGKVINNMNGPNATVFGTQKAQQSCPGCNGTGFEPTNSSFGKMTNHISSASDYK